MKGLWAWALALALLAGCGPAAGNDGVTHILCTTYPVYLFTTAVTDGARDVEVELLVNQQTSCLHDYTLTVTDRKAIDRADVIIVNGAGLEDFLSDALGQKDAPVIDCSAGLDLLPTPEHAGHDGHDHEEEYDPHYWMDPRNAAQMLRTIGDGLCPRMKEGQDLRRGAYETAEALERRAEGWQGDHLDSGFITFHDGFQYFAGAYGLDLIKSMEEEEGAEASAKELMEVIELVEARRIPAIFVEKNGSRRSANVIARETGCKVYELDMVMSGEGQGITPYMQAMEQNLATVKEAFS